MKAEVNSLLTVTATNIENTGIYWTAEKLFFGVAHFDEIGICSGVFGGRGRLCDRPPFDLTDRTSI